MKYPAPVYEFIPASNFISVAPGGRIVKLLVVHASQNQELRNTARNVAKWFKGQPTKPPGTSAHIIMDAEETIQCVHDKDVAFAVPFANRIGMHFELVGMAEQTAAQWDDAYSRKVLERAADSFSDYALHFEIPVVHLTNDQLKAGWNGKAYTGPPGIIGHSQASDIFKPNNNHRDPGLHFPWDSFILRTATLAQQKCGNA